MGIEPETPRPGTIKKMSRPASNGGPKYRVERLKGSDRRKVTVLSEMFYGFQIHYDAATRRSEPCFEDLNECPGCKAKRPSKRLFYLFVWEAGVRPYFLELTEQAAAIMDEILAGEETYRGITMEFSRTPANNGRIRVLYLQQYERPANLPPDKNPEETLKILWNWGRDLPK